MTEAGRAATAGWSRELLAAGAGVELEVVDRFLELGIVGSTGTPETLETDTRKVRVAHALGQAGLPLDALGEGIRTGSVSLDFVGQPQHQRYASMAELTFREASQQRNIPIELLYVVRDAIGGEQPQPDDRMRREEVAILPLVALQVQQAFRPTVIERSLRGIGDSMQRVAEIEADWWRTEVQAPLMESGRTPDEIRELTSQFKPDLMRAMDEALIAVLHGQQANAWLRNLLASVEYGLARAGLYERPVTMPAICFLDLTGYSRLTDEKGDEAAADLAARLGRLVQRSASRHGGQAVKWLGDGVMFHFGRAGEAVVAALEMVQEAEPGGLPPAHVGVHAGPVLYQAGDYFGRTVNIASRIADYARQGEVLVSQQVVEASDSSGVMFSEIGPVELRGLSGALRLHAAHMPTEALVVT